MREYVGVMSILLSLDVVIELLRLYQGDQSPIGLGATALAAGVNMIFVCWGVALLAASRGTK